MKIDELDELTQRTAMAVISALEAATVDGGVSLRDAARVCRDVSVMLHDRAEAFEDEADTKDEP